MPWRLLEQIRQLTGMIITKRLEHKAEEVEARLEKSDLRRALVARNEKIAKICHHNHEFDN